MATAKVPNSADLPTNVSAPLRGLTLWAIGFWAAWMAILPLGHVTGLRTALALPTIGFAFVVAVRWRGWRSLAEVPALTPWLLLLVWCILSLTWSAAPDVTWSKLRFDLLVPFGAYLAGYLLARCTGAAKFLLLGPLIGTLLLTMLSLFVWLPVPNWMATDVRFGTVEEMPFWYPGVGDASAFSVLMIGPLLACWVVGRNKSIAVAKWGAVLAMLAIMVVIVATNRRNALIVSLLVTPLFFLLLARDAKKKTGKKVGAMLTALVLGALVVAGMFEYGARARLMPEERAALPPNTSAAIMLMKGEARPRIWNYYFKRAQQHPWFGVGFGRTVPGILYDTKNDASLVAIDPLAVIHAHNLLLNWMLQTGIIGLAIFIALLAVIWRQAWRARQLDFENRALACAVIVTIVAMLLRNMTDDFLVYGIATMFWATLGSLFGLIECRRFINQKGLPPPMTSRPHLSSIAVEGK